MSQFHPVVEVLKWTSPRDSLLSHTHISRIWSEAASSDELWNSFCQSLEYPPPAQGKPAKQWFYACFCKYRFLAVSRWHAVVYSVPKLSARVVELKKEILSSTSYCFLTTDTVLCCGGADTSHVYQVNLHTGIVQQRRSMIFPRCNSGILKHSNSVYMLGGATTKVGQLSCEKCDLVSEFWSLTKGSMSQERSHFTPFVHSGKIYCIGPRYTIEFMDLVSELFSVAPVKLIETNSWAMSVPFGDYMVVVQPNAVSVWGLELLGLTMWAKVEDVCWSNYPPVRHKNALYYVDVAKRNRKIIMLDWKKRGISVVTEKDTAGGWMQDN